MTKILIVDDHPMFREALRSAVKFSRKDAEILEAGSIEAAHEIIRDEPGIEIVLLDLSLPGTRGFDGLILLGYPLHPPGKPEKLRDAHLYSIRIPMLFFAGSRDPLCDPAELEKVLARLSAPWELETIDGGNHSFRVPKAMGLSDEAVYGRILEKTLHWLEPHEESGGRFQGGRAPGR